MLGKRLRVNRRRMKREMKKRRRRRRRKGGVLYFCLPPLCLWDNGESPRAESVKE